MATNKRWPRVVGTGLGFKLVLGEEGVMRKREQEPSFHDVAAKASSARRCRGSILHLVDPKESEGADNMIGHHSSPSKS